jgi:hypothetical protein
VRRAAACGAHAAGERAAGGSRTLPHALLAVGVRVALPAAQTHCTGLPGPLGALSALSVDAPVGAPPERERKISHSTPPSRDERRRRVTTVSWRTAACKPPDLPRHLRMPGLARRVRGCTANGRGRPPQPRGSAAAGAVRVTRRCSGTSSALPCRPERTGGGALAAPSTRGAPRPMGGESTELSPPAVLSAPRLASVGPSVASAASQSDAGAAAGGAASAAACPSSTMAVDALLLPRAVGRRDVCSSVSGQTRMVHKFG